MNFLALAILFLAASSSLEVNGQEAPVGAGDEIRIPVKQSISFGRDSRPTRYSYLASIRGPGGGHHACGGALITPDTVVTAAHCIDPSKPLPEVHIGRYCQEKCPKDLADYTDAYEVAGVESVHVPEDWNPARFYKGSDIAVLKLDRWLEGWPTVKVAKEGDVSLWASLILTTVGLGVNESDANGSYTLPDVVQEGFLPYRKSSTCEEIFWKTNSLGSIELPSDFAIADNQMCAGGYKTSSCNGDSGGPLLLKGTSLETDVLVGIVSFGVACGSDVKNPAVFTRVTAFEEFLAPLTLIPAPPAPPSPPPAIRIPPNVPSYEFTQRVFCSDWLGVFALKSDRTEWECRTQCDKMDYCSGYSFRQPNGVCVLFRDCPATMTEMRGMTALKKAPKQTTYLSTANGASFKVWRNRLCTAKPFQVFANRTLEQCEGICSRSKRCSVYTFNAASKMCRLRTKCGYSSLDNAQRSGRKEINQPNQLTTQGSLADDAATVDDVLDAAEAQAAANYNYLETTSCIGGDLQRAEVLEDEYACEAACSDESDCAAFTWHTKSKLCSLKAVCGSMKSRKNFKSGVKKALVYPMVLEGYTCRGPVKKTKTDIDSLDECDKLCKEFEWCTAFVLRSDVKKCFLKETCTGVMENDYDTTGFLKALI